MSTLQTDKAQNFNPADQLSRVQWSKMIAAIMAQLPMPVIHLIAEQGFHKFLGTAGPILDGHKFETEDLKRIFRVIKRTSQLNRRHGTKVVLAEA